MKCDCGRVSVLCSLFGSYLLKIASAISQFIYDKQGTTEWKVLLRCHLKALAICDAKVKYPVFQKPLERTTLFLCKYTKLDSNKYERMCIYLKIFCTVIYIHLGCELSLIWKTIFY